MHKTIRRLGFEVLAELCMRIGKVIWLNQRQLWNICLNVVVDCLIVNSAQPVSFVTVCMTQQAEQLCRRVQSTSYQLKHWLAADNNRRIQAVLSGKLHISCWSGASTAWLIIDHNPSLWDSGFTPRHECPVCCVDPHSQSPVPIVFALFERIFT